MPDEKMNEFPEITPFFELAEEKRIIPSTPLHEMSKQERIDRQIALVDQYHPHIAKGIKMMWGYKECVDYLDKLVLSGGDGAGKVRVGFRLEIMSALIDLSTLHEVTKLH